jgi:hypothetical protein
VQAGMDMSGVVLLATAPVAAAGLSESNGIQHARVMQKPYSGLLLRLPT